MFDRSGAAIYPPPTRLPSPYPIGRGRPHWAQKIWTVCLPTPWFNLIGGPYLWSILGLKHCSRSFIGRSFTGRPTRPTLIFDLLSSRYKIHELKYYLVDQTALEVGSIIDREGTIHSRQSCCRSSCTSFAQYLAQPQADNFAAKNWWRPSKAGPFMSQVGYISVSPTPLDLTEIY